MARFWGGSESATATFGARSAEPKSDNQQIYHSANARKSVGTADQSVHPFESLPDEL
jgi:hypothetical protein